ncbi:MAG: four helix bundle protein [Verrucomicrobia bacterium]|jgi:restriction system protein|nr:four helix bundle protein [Verrucomicrobiota bacterium]MBT7701475.1 four helix bundle protein [Verrucomicrobiota bacterium]
MKKSGGYRKLNTFTYASIIQLATWRFCNMFLKRSNDPCGRQFDQMTQAARSGKANIVEGSERAGTSNTTEMRLTDVARASLGELQGDYEFWLASHKKLPWSTSSPEFLELKAVLLDPNPLQPGDDLCKATEYLFSQQEKFERWLESAASEVVANAMIVLLQRTIGMLKKQLASQEETFLKDGGFRERMNSARLDERDRQNADPEAPSCPDCGKPMRRCTAKAGSNAGKAFWGCTGFPDCRGIVNIGR